MKPSAVDNYAAFEDAVKENFSFLKESYGFRLRQIMQVGYAKLIRYESPVVYVKLMYGPPAYEPEMSFGRIGVDDVEGARSFHPGDLVLLKSSSGWKWGATNPDNSAMVEIISGYAQLLRECGSACLRGDQSTFAEMMERRDKAAKAWHQEENSNRVRTDVQFAWDRKDYRAVVKLYESIVDVLTDTEKKKLEYAKKHLIG